MRRRTRRPTYAHGSPTRARQRMSPMKPRPVKGCSYSFMYWYMCRLDASHRCLVVNKGCRLSPSTSLSSSWFLLLAYIAPVVGINRTRRLPTCRSHTLHSPFAYIARILLLLRPGFPNFRNDSHCCCCCVAGIGVLISRPFDQLSSGRPSTAGNTQNESAPFGGLDDHDTHNRS